MKNRDYEVIVPVGINKPPKDFEFSAAEILAEHFRRNIYFIKIRSIHTPDVKIGNIEWEIKSPTGTGKRTIQHQFERAARQSSNVVLDLRRLRIPNVVGVREAKYNFKMNRNVKRLAIITKRERNNLREKVLVFEK